MFLDWPYHGSFIASDIRTIDHRHLLYDHGQCLLLFDTRSRESHELCRCIHGSKLCIHGDHLSSNRHECSRASMGASLLPISHYIEVQTALSSYGINAAQTIVQLLPMFGYVIPAIITLLLIRKHLNVQPMNGAVQ